MASFAGHLLHSGDPIIRGTRYIIAAFMILIPINDDHEPQHQNISNEEKEQVDNSKLSSVWSAQSQKEKNESGSIFSFNNPADNTENPPSFQFSFSFGMG